MIIGSDEYQLSLKLQRGYLIDKEIGRGEASAIALAVKNNGILASNNTRDMIEAIKTFNLKRIKTGDILVKALHYKIITEDEGNEIWKKMLNQKRYLTKKSFSNYLKKNPNDIF